MLVELTIQVIVCVRVCVCVCLYANINMFGNDD